MAKIKYSNPGGKKKSVFFAVEPGGDSLIATLTSPRKIVSAFRKNSRNRNKVFTVSSN